MDTKPLLRQRETELAEIITAVETISVSKEWKTLRKTIFDDLVKSLEKRVLVESSSNEINIPSIYRLNGQLTFAKKYADFEKLADAYRIELKNIRKKLNE